MPFVATNPGCPGFTLMLANDIAGAKVMAIWAPVASTFAVSTGFSTAPSHIVKAEGSMSLNGAHVGAVTGGAPPNGMAEVMVALPGPGAKFVMVTRNTPTNGAPTVPRAGCLRLRRMRRAVMGIFAVG